ncbi:MAG: FmdE family protein [Chitinophagales bacterium]
MCRDKSPLEQAVDFHGHICPGLLMGVRAAQFAMQYLDVEPDYDEELLAIVEHKSCGVDAIQAILGCTMGKGNLIFRDYGKQVYIVASRKNGRAVRMILKPDSRKGPNYDRFRELAQKDTLTGEEENEKDHLRGVLFEDIMQRPFDSLFDYREVEFQLPEKAKIYPTVICDVCGEGVMEPKAVRTDKGLVCPDCMER